MQQRDYIKRQLEELGKVLAKILADIMRLKEHGKIQEAYVLAKDNLVSQFDLDMEHILSLSKEDFQLLIIKGNQLNPTQLNYLAELLYTSAGLLEEKEEQQINDLYTKALLIYQHLNRVEKTFSIEREKKITAIEQHFKTIS
ncbi:MAG TPA: hypothetical protein VGC65_10585 [Bacteroidia bacterium]|jgi:hypothetical protein